MPFFSPRQRSNADPGLDANAGVLDVLAAFTDPASADALHRVLDYFDRCGLFTDADKYLFEMPTVEAWDAAVGLCAAICAAKMQSDDKELRAALYRYIDAHRAGRSFGGSEWTRDDVRLYAVDMNKCSDKSKVLNPIQTMFYLERLKKEGLYTQARVSPL